MYTRSLASVVLCAIAAVAVCTNSVQAGPVQLFKLLADDGQDDDFFGWSVSLSGSTAIVGARRDDDNGSRSGSAYVFDVSTGEQLFKLLADDGEAFDDFGWSVSVSGSYAIVGAPGEGDNGPSSGSVYVFDVTTGEQLAKLLPDDGQAFEGFGRSVSISGTTAIVGAPLDDFSTQFGSVYVFDVITGEQLFKLLPDDRQEGDFFGDSVSISGSTAIIGATYDDDNGCGSGSAYIFDVSTGKQLFKLLPDDGQAEDLFGISVSISGSFVIVGALGLDDEGYTNGSAYVFKVSTGEQLFKLLPDDGELDDYFGGSVSISGSTAIVGASYDDENGSNSGSMYIFDVTTGEQLSKILTDDGQADDYFGHSISLSGSAAIAGASFDDDNGSRSGSAYVYDVSAGALGCPGDCDGSGTVEFNDLVSMLFEFGGPGAPGCDTDGSGTVDFNDLVAALFLFGDCPGSI